MVGLVLSSLSKYVRVKLVGVLVSDVAVVVLIEVQVGGLFVVVVVVIGHRSLI